MCIHYTHHIFIAVCPLALSSGRPSSQQPALVLTTQLRLHLSRIVEEYWGLQNKASALAIESGGKEHDRVLYQRMSFLEPVVKLAQQLEAKELVRLHLHFT